MAASAPSGGDVGSGSGPMAERLREFAAPTVWHEFTPLAAEVGAVNLGQGFPGWASPAFVKDALVRAVREEHNQYARSAGHPLLTERLAAEYSRRLARYAAPWPPFSGPMIPHACAARSTRRRKWW